MKIPGLFNIYPFIFKGGKVGLGIVTAASLLHVKDASIPIYAERSTTEVSTTVSAILAKATSSGNMADGFGAGILFGIEDNAGALNYAGGVYGIRDGADNTCKIHFRLYSAGSIVVGAQISAAGDFSTLGACTVGTGFGCNSKGAQTAYASGGDIAPGEGTVGAADSGRWQNMVALVRAIRIALVANGIMS
jgi:hypothetical protein